MVNQGILIFDRFILGFRLHVLGCLEAQDSRGFCAFFCKESVYLIFVRNEVVRCRIPQATMGVFL